MSADPWFNGHRPTLHPTSTADFLAGLNDAPWATDALCAQTDPEAFYPKKAPPGEGRANVQPQQLIAQAKAVCNLCPVQVPCLDYALATEDEHGVWGGLTANQRRKIRRGRKAAE